MGMPIGVSRSTVDICEDARRPKGNPNPWKFRLISSVKIGNFYLVELVYPDCTNFEGRKVLVMNCNPSTRLQIDPHFTENGCIVARFAPTKEGKILAEMYLHHLELQSD